MRHLVRAREEEDTQIDITPMLDVVFIMLIFFIVTASFVKETGLSINKPESSKQDNPADSENKPILVEVNELDQIRIDSRRVDSRSVKPTIIRMMAENPEGIIIVQADKESTTKAVMQAVDGICEAYGGGKKCTVGNAPTIVVKE